MQTRPGPPVPPGSGSVAHNAAKYLMLPAIAPLSILALYFTPKETFGCANRGLMALAVTGISLLAAVATTWRYARDRSRRGGADFLWPLAATLLLILPALLLLGPLG